MIYPETTQSPEEVATHYNSLDQYYRKLWGEHLHHGFWKSGHESVEEATEELIRLVAEAGKITENSLVCDVGCGYGGTSRFLVEHYKAHLTSLTLSEAQLDYAKAQTPDTDNPNYLLSDFLQSELPSDHFDVVLSIESSEHMVDKKKFFHEVTRILKPGGRFVTCAWLAKNSPKKWEVKHFLEPICREGRLPSMGSELDYREMMVNAGLQEIAFRDISNSVKKTWAICIGRASKAFFSDKELRSYLLSRSSSDRVFAKTLLRLWGAYELKSMRYGLFTASKQ
ncbi:MAG: 27-O-demethylrifamycin SV methyltransferase [Chlamydiae bacterium]|nr:27-O-demethylrifamycin SV methyltransferase [Chlamydiota bacterium]